MAGAKKPTKKTAKKRPATKKSSTAAKPAKTVAIPSATTPRRLKRSQYKAFRLSKRIKHPVKLPTGWQLTKQTGRLLADNWKVVLGIVAVYGALNIVLVRGLNGGLDVASLKHSLDQLSQGGWAHIRDGFNIFALLVSSSNTVNSDVAGAYQTFLVLITSLALVWTFRQLRMGKTVRIRDGFYAGTYPLIPIMLLLLVIGLQAIPLLIGGWLFTTVVQGGIAVGFLEQFLWGLLFFALAILSLYMMCSSIFALYIATLPKMTPVKALRSARELVRNRRSQVLRKILYLPLILLIGCAIVMVPFIFLIPILAQWVFFGLGMIMLAVTHGYMYNLYRELLQEKVHVES